MADMKLPTRAEDYSEWYNQLVLRAELADYAPVRGCMIVRPYGWALWENITAALDSRYVLADQLGFIDAKLHALKDLGKPKAPLRPSRRSHCPSVLGQTAVWCATPSPG